MSNDLRRIKTDRRIRAMEISYDTLCATPRMAPSKEYCEFEVHPDKKRVYTFSLETHRKITNPHFK